MKKLLALACAAVAFVAASSEWKSAIDLIVNDANLPAKEKIAVLRATAEGAGDARGEFVGAIRELAAETPVGRLGTPADIAASVLFLSGEGASFVTGQVLSPNGGFTVT